MAANQTNNPYEATDVKLHGSSGAVSRVAATIGVVGFVIGVSPTLYMCCICIASLWTVATIEIPTTSIRPMGLAVAMLGLTVVGVAFTPIALGLSWIAKRLGSREGAMLAKLSVGFIAFPLLLGFVTFIAIMIVCGLRGISIGD